MRSPSIDVVVLSLNRVEMTLETVESVLQQRDVEATVWLIDQGSNEATIAQLRALRTRRDDVRLIENGTNRGVPGGRNIGTAAGSAPIVVSVDNDAVFDTCDALSRVVAAFESEPELGAIGFRVLNHQTREVDRVAWGYPMAMLPMAHQPFRASRFAGTGHAIRRSAFEEVGGYDDSLFFCWEELDLSYRLIDAGYHLRYEPDITILHRVAPDERVEWSGDRFYYLVRNGLFLRHKFTGRYSNLAVAGLGYALKGARNRCFGQAMKGVRDAVRMSHERSRREGSRPLGPAARRYIHEFETARRGSLLTRFRTEVVGRLPAARS